ncbi:hypothetical protein XCR1_2860004 [Xenorhabdus cabanillasii JM26]|uniref:Uncharacterized protein n=1 Tax=Xenorhabdus cabanillasii JM26 TaxID=1427517 RepID=W1J659_9GAMM|nr:hypothetical protein Xcab_03857 [Xenorhabdus cabanillasii JM26]CDL86214.1 hypothetical protein XCR1_2860004 [Xenorhabdus cabanillasii JM26]
MKSVWCYQRLEIAQVSGKICESEVISEIERNPVEMLHISVDAGCDSVIIGNATRAVVNLQKDFVPIYRLRQLLMAISKS